MSAGFETGIGSSDGFLADKGLASAIIQSVDALQTDAVDLLSALVREPSVMGHEQGAQKVIAETFTGLGLAVDTIPVDDAAISLMPGYSPSIIPYDGRMNVVGAHRPRVGGGRSLLFNGHIDVVPAGPLDMWSHPPFDPIVRSGRLYGRGAGDMKAGIVAYTIAYKALKAMGKLPAAPVFLQTVIEEECTGNGTLAILGTNAYHADAAIIPEPFGHTLMVAELGVMWVSFTVTGRAAHMIDRGQGTSAIDAAYALARHIKDLEAAWNAPKARHPLYADQDHPINFNLGRIEGGEWTSSVPARCTLHFRLSFYPNQSVEEVKSAIHAAVEKAKATDPMLAGATVTTAWQGFQAPGFVAERAHPMMDVLARSHRAVFNEDIKELACTCTTDARFFTLWGSTPATCYGPEATSIHTFDESVSLSSLRDVARVLALFMAAWCGLEEV